MLCIIYLFLHAQQIYEVISNDYYKYALTEDQTGAHTSRIEKIHQSEIHQSEIHFK
jgi:hypothetical protein